MCGVQVGRGGRRGDESMREMGKDFCPKFLQPFLENIDRINCNDGSLLQYFTTLTENADPLLWRRLAPWSALKGCPLRPRRAGGRKKKFGSISKRPLNILKVVKTSFPKSSPLQEKKAQSLQSLFVGEVTHASNQPCS